MPEITTIEVSDDRPPVPPTPTAYICRYWKWRDADAFCPAGRWNLHTSMFCRLSREDVDKEASELIAEGCRNVTIIKIEGD